VPGSIQVVSRDRYILLAANVSMLAYPFTCAIRRAYSSSLRTARVPSFGSRSIGVRTICELGQIPCRSGRPRGFEVPSMSLLPFVVLREVAWRRPLR
jgi:hypothetical protein